MHVTHELQIMCSIYDISGKLPWLLIWLAKVHWPNIINNVIYVSLTILKVLAQCVMIKSLYSMLTLTCAHVRILHYTKICLPQTIFVASLSPTAITVMIKVQWTQVNVVLGVQLWFTTMNVSMSRYCTLIW